MQPLNRNVKSDSVIGAEPCLAVEVTTICDGRGSPTLPSASENVKLIDTEEVSFDYLKDGIQHTA
jgi:hypothetical protein